MDDLAAHEACEQRAADVAEMKRPMEIASGIGVLVMSLVGSMAVLKVVFDVQSGTQRLSIVSAISLSVTGLAISLSFVGAFILLSWANKPK